MTFLLRPYQQRSIAALHQWWARREGHPICVLPTGAGKSVVIAELCRQQFDAKPAEHPRTVVLVPSKELAEQNAAKLRAMLPNHLSVGYYSAGLGCKMPDADVIVATIGSIYRDAQQLGNIKCVVIDECHLVNPGGDDAGRYRQFLRDLSERCTFRVVGYTATPFRGDGVWLTDGAEALFSGVACSITVQELLEAGYLSSLVRPIDVVGTRIDTSGIKTAGGDYNLRELAERVQGYIPTAAAEAVHLAASRRKWIAFTATVANANQLRNELTRHGIDSAVVTGDTPKDERAMLIERFRRGELRCLVTVLALATGFDVPDVDCILWLRPTQSPVLYVQGAGRGMRTADSKSDCLWLDFSDTTERLGPVDTIKGRQRLRRRKEDAEAPYKICDNCGERTPTAAPACPTCGFQFPVAEKEVRPASNAAVMSNQADDIMHYFPITLVLYTHQMQNRKNVMHVEYFNRGSIVHRELVFFEHEGSMLSMAKRWWDERSLGGKGNYSHEKAYGRRYPINVSEAIEAATKHSSHIEIASHSCSTYFFAVPYAISVCRDGRYPAKFHWTSQ